MFNGVWVYGYIAVSAVSACLEMPSKKGDRGTVQYGGRGREGETGKTLFNIRRHNEIFLTWVPLMPFQTHYRYW